MPPRPEFLDEKPAADMDEPLLDQGDMEDGVPPESIVVEDDVATASVGAIALTMSNNIIGAGKLANIYVE